MCIISLDAFDLALLAVLQHDGHATHQQLLEQVRLSASQVGRYLTRLESKDVIKSYRVMFSPAGPGLGVTVFANIKLTHHGDAIVERFHEEINLLDAVQEYYSVANDADYMLRVVVPGLPVLSESVMRKPIRVPSAGNVRSNIVLAAPKRDGVLPLSHLGR